MEVNKLEGKTLDGVSENVSVLAQAFPEVIVDGKVDFEKLRLILGEDIEDAEERYSFTWPGKREAIKLAISRTTGTLRPDKENSKDWDTTQNLFIEGDNLEVLRVLQNTYRGKVKMIYIDPPYNTGKDFVYKDDFKDNIANYKEQAGLEGQSNADTTGRYHTNWLNMMYPRLRLAKNLLREDGVIFISIDDNEMHNLRRLMDEIFGEENLLSIHHLQVRYGNKSLNERKDFQELCEYVLIYSKNASTQLGLNKPTDSYPIEKFNLAIQHQDNPSETFTIGNRTVDVWRPGNFEIIKKESGSVDLFKETWISGSILSGTGHGKMYTKVVDARRNTDGDGCLYRIHGIGEDGLGYRYYSNPVKADANRGKMYTKVPLDKLEDVTNGDSLKENPIINFYDYSGDFGNIRQEGGIAFNAGKKPIKLIKQFLNYFKERDYIVLDFFAGSASTAHAVISQNLEDGGNRRFIMVQLPEKTPEDNDAFKDGYKTISEISRGRINLAGEKIAKENADDLKERTTPLDIGFKAFTLDTTNFREWDTDTEDINASLLAALDTFKQGRTSEDALYEVLLKYGVDLTEPVEVLTLDGKQIYSLAGNYLLVCLEKNISLATVEEMAKLKPTRVVCYDDGFENDEVKQNALETLKRAGVEDVRVI